MMEQKKNDKSSDIIFFIMVPVYNVEKYIQKCIESVLNQTYQKFELVLIDDGSSDLSGRICDDYASCDKRITVIHQKNKGLIAARQKAIQYLRSISDFTESVYAIFLDSDDSLKTHALETIQKVLSQFDCDMLIYGMDRVIDGKIVRKYNQSKGYGYMISDKQELYRKVFNSAEYNSLCRKAVSIKIIPDIDYSDYYHISHAEDLLQSIFLYKNCNNVFFLNENLYNYTVNPCSITQTVSEKNFKVDFTVRSFVSEFLEYEKIFSKEDWKQYTSYCIHLINNMLQKILSFSITNGRKKEYFSEIRNSQYFQKYIKYKSFSFKYLTAKDLLLYLLFEKGFDQILFLIWRLYKLVSKKLISK